MRIRMQRGGLTESLQTMENVETHEELCNFLSSHGYKMADAHAKRRRKQNGSPNNPPTIEIDFIGTQKYLEVPDHRCGWQETWLVLVRPKGSNDFAPVAFADGDISSLH